VSERTDFQTLVGSDGRAPSLLVVVAHPDDETIGAGALLGELPDVHVVFATDGAPRDGTDARAAGLDSPAAYAEARKREAHAALAIAGVPPARVAWLGFTDQELSHALVPAARRIAALVAELRPDVVLTHAYEGGHPDHDATAFAVRAALALRPGPVLVEVALYHEHEGGAGVERLVLLPGPPGASVSCRLSATEQARKRAMCACYVTQQAVLASFPRDIERFRRASPTRFAAPPHAGLLHYERWPWGMSGRRFCALATEALGTLGLPHEV
jgi:LmbE family N-acetylglucosaminyl deacetylase